jgi:membrane protein
MRRTAREIAGLFGETLHRCVLHSVDTQSAALAFYSLLALAPALLAVVSFGGRFLTEVRVHAELVRQLTGVMGPEASRAVVAVLEKVSDPETGAGPVGIAGILVLLLGTTAVFLQLQEALNRVWEVAPRPGTMLRALLKRRVVSFALVLAAGLLLLVSVTFSAGLMALTDLLTARIPFPVALITLGNEALSFVVLTVLLTLIYRVLPDAKLEWQDVAIGAVVTSTLFSTGKWLIGVVLGWTAGASQLGVVGSVVVILMWVYYESYIVLFGAELTAVYSSRYRPHPVRPEAGATLAGQRPGRVPA